MIIYLCRRIFQSTLKIKCLSIKLFRILNLCSEQSFSFFSFGSVLRSNNFLLKHKISEQQINPKVLSVVSSCHYNGNSKHGKYVYRQMPAPWELSQQISPGKSLDEKAPGWGQIFYANARGARGDGYG